MAGAVRESRLAAIPLGLKQPKTRFSFGTKNQGRSRVNSLSLPLAKITPVTSLIILKLLGSAELKKLHPWRAVDRVDLSDAPKAIDSC